MPNYAYRGYTDTGLRRDGRSRRRGRRRRNKRCGSKASRSCGFPPRRPRKRWRTISPRSSISQMEIILFTRQLATFVGAGVPMSRALGTMAEETGSPHFKRIILAILEDLERGRKPLGGAGQASACLPGALRRPDPGRRADREPGGHPEGAGGLSSAATSISIRRVRTAMIYPAVIMVVATGVVLILVFFALPAFVKIFAEFHVQLPLPTRILIGIVDFTRTWVLAIAEVGLAVALGIVLTLRTARGVVRQGPAGAEASDLRTDRLVGHP